LRNAGATDLRALSTAAQQPRRGGPAGFLCVIEDDPALLESLMPKGYRARPEQAILFRVAAWDTNCRSTSRRSSMPPTSRRR
jgi:hypothetical protein